MAQKGVVAASQPLAVSAGLHILQQGGSFADAAIAASAVLAVVEPHNSHLGGDAFLVVYDAATNRTTALNGSGAAPQKATRELFPDGIPLRGLRAASVPGLVSTWFALHERWGTRPFSELLAPAIAYAENGYPCSYRTSRVFSEHSDLFSQFPETLQTLTGGATVAPGSLLRQPDLAWTLRQIAQDGRDAFYNGAITERILHHSGRHDGLFAAEDFAQHQTQITAPIQTTYRGYRIHGQPPVSQGHILLQELNIVEGYDLAAFGHNSADAIHVQVEAKKLAFADRYAYLGDPAFVQVPMEPLLSKTYATRQRERIALDRVLTNPTAGVFPKDTTYFLTADAQGNAVSFIQSVFWGYGCGEIAECTGVLFNNRMNGFSLDPASPNILAPGKRTVHTLNAYLATSESDGKLAYVGGTPGADVQVQSNLQVLCNVIDFHMNPQEAIEAPRWQHVPLSDGSEQALYVEDRVSPEILRDLSRRGHRLELLPAWGHGSSYQLLALQPGTGIYLAGSDPRCDGHAAGF